MPENSSRLMTFIEQFVQPIPPAAAESNLGTETFTKAEGGDTDGDFDTMLLGTQTLKEDVRPADADAASSAGIFLP